MSKHQLKALVLRGDGINCEKETAAACKEAGFHTQVVHVNDLLATSGKPLAETTLLVIPGGFSFGDELGSGKILAIKLKHGLKSSLDQFLANKGAVLGICNGFQVLTRLGVFGPGLVLAQNSTGRFMNRWVGLEITGKSIFTNRFRSNGVSRLELPIRHGEGRLLVTQLLSAEAVLRYEQDVNGSWNQLAGLSSFDGRVMGLMPHPEAFWTEELYPSGSRGKLPLGVEFFNNAYYELNQ